MAERAERFNFARDVFDRHAREGGPERLAMQWVDDEQPARRFTFDELSRRSRGLAAGLGTEGLRRGQTLMLVLPRRVEWWETMLAALRGGFVVAPGT
ncbi:MAG TPA: AMP-binding protein, partial [Planctomycetota bacterium]|nr:AMP-binding protein [Planctomycetota bacterium]